MKWKKTIILFHFMLISIIVMSFLQDDLSVRNIQKIAMSLISYQNYVKPQKIYLHTDKTRYFSGEQIWFKAYLINGITHRSDSLIDPVYVELLNPYQKTVQVLRLRINAGTGSGSFVLGDTIPEGIYQIRAYTNWMKNSGPSFFFNKNLEIRNPKKEFLITAKEARSNKKTIKKLEKDTRSYRIGFYPEGGKLLTGVRCKVAFKVSDISGTEIPARGIIYDRNKKEVASFNTEYDGMGTFTFIPQKNNLYSASMSFPDGSTKKIPLPEAEDNAVSFSLNEFDNIIELKLNSNKQPSNDRPANEFIVLGQVRGEIFYASSKNLLDRDSTYRIRKNIFPSGIVHFTLFNNRLTPVAERLFFINHNDFTQFEIPAYKIVDSIHLEIKPQNLKSVGNLFAGSVSVTIPESENQETSESNILTELLLTSDLPGSIRNPSYYLHSEDPQANKHVDLLMLTHGWKRFIWEEVLSQDYAEMSHRKEESISIEGRITHEFFNIPVKNASVKLYVLNAYNDEYSTTTSSNGWFNFDDLDYPDTMNVRVVARKPAGGKNVLILINQDPIQKIQEYTGEFFLTTTSKIDMKKYRRVQAEIAREEMRRREKELDSIYSNSIHGKPDFVLWGDEIPDGCSSILDAIQGRIPGVTVTGNSIIIRGISTFMGGTDPLLIVDGVITSIDALQSIPVEDVDRIEILKGPSTSIYGSQGANGVIAIYTKHGTFMKKGEISFSMLGYHVVEQYYCPSNRNLTTRLDHQQLPITIYWNPDIIIKPDYSTSISFPLQNIPRQGLWVTFEGINNEGRPGFSQVYFNNP